MPTNGADFARETDRQQDEAIQLQRMFASAINQDSELSSHVHLDFAGLDSANLPLTKPA
ncbi:TPA: hypothetical protein KNH08_002609 [Serratia fonticola]|nr:hypothetical protein [Serratia fonticola]